MFLKIGVDKKFTLSFTTTKNSVWSRKVYKSKFLVEIPSTVEYVLRLGRLKIAYVKFFKVGVIGEKAS